MMRPGFADPVFHAQASFRAVLEAMSRPGRVQLLDLPLTPPAGLDPATAAVLLTLADADTSLNLPASAEDAAEWTRFHCGSPSAAVSEADFVLALDAVPVLSTLRQGTDEAPEQAATLICQVALLEEDRGWHLTGPGISGSHHLRVAGLPADFLQQWAAQRQAFPCGVDVILCAGHRIAALPRSVRIEEA
jgi:alpha-D-ribose 1-methylphosphonate 5-triphosphate synthase subunit PhnH